MAVPIKLQQVPVNVLLNAIYASLLAATIEILAGYRADSATVTVLDAGEEIAEENLGSIFNAVFSPNAMELARD